MNFTAPKNMRSHVMSILAGEYDVPFYNPEPNTISVIDLGLNVGSFSAWANLRWEPFQIYAYEPVLEVYQMAQNNLGHLKNIKLLNSAVRNFNGESSIFLGKNNVGESSFFYDNEEQSKQALDVKCISASELPKAHVIKIDTEGCEKEILEAIDNLNFDLILLEYHSEQLRKQIDNILESYILVSSKALCKDRGIAKYIKDTPELTEQLTIYNRAEINEFGHEQ